jgi:hypothetical protein
MVAHRTRILQSRIYKLGSPALIFPRRRFCPTVPLAPAGVCTSNSFAASLFPKEHSSSPTMSSEKFNESQPTEKYIAPGYVVPIHANNDDDDRYNFSALDTETVQRRLKQRHVQMCVSVVSLAFKR